MKKISVILLILLISSCGIQTDTISYDSSISSDASQFITSLIKDESSQNISESETSSNDSTYDDYFDQLNLYMRFVSRSDSTTFEKKMKSNEIDQQYIEFFSSMSSGSTGVTCLFIEEMLILWEKEIDKALNDFTDSVSEDDLQRITKYTEEFLQIKDDSLRLAYELFSGNDNYDIIGTMEGGFIGAGYVIYLQKYDHYRELTMQLKYWMHLIETETETPVPEDEMKSLIFAYEIDYGAE